MTLISRGLGHDHWAENEKKRSLLLPLLSLNRTRTMMVDSVVAPLPHSSSTDRLDAAHALLGVIAPDATAAPAAEPLETVEESDSAVPNDTGENQDAPVVAGRPRSGSVGLDALAALAVSMKPGAGTNAISASSSDDDSEVMPPPPPRHGRPRSASNPEGMEKWDSWSFDRRHFVLPSSILEEELAEASALAEAKDHEESYESSLPLKKRAKNAEYEFGTSPNCVSSPIMSATSADDVNSSEEDSYPEEDVDVEPEELLRRARSRLLEDSQRRQSQGRKGSFDTTSLPFQVQRCKISRAPTFSGLFE